MHVGKASLSISDTIRHLYKQEGAMRFFRGIKTIASGCVPAHACYFSTYEAAKKYFGLEDGNMHFVSASLVGGLATLSHDAFLTPADVIKQR